jgi:glycosyltransferase involved in cell wall biosynthesis
VPATPLSRPDGRGLRLLVTVTFNPNQLRSHLLPLSGMDEVESIVLVSDVEPPPLEKVRAVVPSARRRRLLGRAGAKLATCLDLARASRFDWVIGFNLVPHGLNAGIVARRTGTRSLYHMIGGELEWRGGGHGSENGVLGRLPRPVPPLERALLRQIGRQTAVATMGPRGREALVRRGIPPERVHVIPPSVDLDRFGSLERAEARWDVVTVGRLSPLKRTSDLLSAIALLGDRGLRVRAGIAGGGPLRDALEAEARGLGVSDRVELLGPVDRVEDVYAQARVFALTSSFEGLPIAMLDAMAAGLPVVASDVGEIGTVVDDGRNGLLYPSGDVEALAGRLWTALAADGPAGRLAAAGAADVAAGFSAGRVGEIYRAVLAG